MIDYGHQVVRNKDGLVSNSSVFTPTYRNTDHAIGQIDTMVIYIS